MENNTQKQNPNPNPNLPTPPIPPIPLSKVISLTITEICALSGMTQEKFSDQVRVTRSAVANWLAERTIPARKHQIRIFQLAFRLGIYSETQIKKIIRKYPDNPLRLESIIGERFERMEALAALVSDGNKKLPEGPATVDTDPEPKSRSGGGGGRSEERSGGEPASESIESSLRLPWAYKLQYILTHTSYTETFLASCLQVDRSTLAAWLRGERAPSTRMQWKIQEIAMQSGVSIMAPMADVFFYRLVYNTYLLFREDNSAEDISPPTPKHQSIGEKNRSRIYTNPIFDTIFLSLPPRIHPSIIRFFDTFEMTPLISLGIYPEDVLGLCAALTRQVQIGYISKYKGTGIIDKDDEDEFGNMSIRPDPAPVYRVSGAEDIRNQPGGEKEKAEKAEKGEKLEVYENGYRTGVQAVQTPTDLPTSNPPINTRADYPTPDSDYDPDFVDPATINPIIDAELPDRDQSGSIDDILNMIRGAEGEDREDGDEEGDGKEAGDGE